MPSKEYVDLVIRLRDLQAQRNEIQNEIDEVLNKLYDLDEELEDQE